MKTKNQFTNRIIGLVLALVMVLGMLPMTRFTASAESTQRTTKLSLSVTSGNIQNEAEGWSWVKGEDAWTLTLNNANIEVADDVAVYLNTSTNTEPRNINIVFNGDNRIVSTKSSSQEDISSLGIKIEDFKAGMPNVTFSGNGTLLVKGQSCGIYSANNIIFDNANVTVEGGYYGCINLASTDGSNGNSLIIKNNSIVNVNHSTSDGNAYKNTIDAVYGNITVENSTLNVSAASNGGTLTLVKAAKNISVSNSTLALNVTGTGTTWRWGVSAPTISISNSTVNATNIYNLASMVVGGSSNNVVTMTNVNGAFLHTVNVASGSATMESCNIYHCSRTGNVTVYGNVTLPDSVSEITDKLSFKNNTDSLSIPSGRSITFSGTPSANTGTIINNGSLIIYSPNTFNGSSCTLSGTGDFLLMTEVTSDCIVVPNDLVYTGSVLLTQDTDKVYLHEPQGTVTILKTSFKQQLLDKAKWVLSFDRTVLNAGEYTATFTNNGKTITKPFDVKAADIAGATVTLNPTSGTYDGTEQKPTVSVVWNNMKLLENTDYTVSYVDNVNASGATVLATAYIDGINNFTGRKEAVFEISNAQLTEVEVKQKGTLTYNGQRLTPIVTTKAKSVNNQPITFTYSTSPYGTYDTMPDFTNAGTYTVYFKASAPNHNYVTGSFTVTVDKADQAAPIGIGKTDETIFGKDDGVIMNVDASMEFRKEGETTYRVCTGDRVIDLASGTYYVRFKGSDNYNPSPDQAVTIGAGEKLKIVVPQNPVGYTVTVNKTEMEYEGIYTLKVEIKEGYTATEDFKILISNWECGQQPNVEETYMNAIADQIIEVHGVADITPPNVEIDVKGNKWTSFWNNLTFGFFFKETQDVTITANDAGTGVKTVQYYLSDRELERDEVRAITDWVDYNGTFKINPDYKYVVYAKVADNDGNVAYINSAGIVLYSDSTLDTTIKDKITYVLTKNAEQAFTLNLNGNTVAYVKIDNIVLGNEDYEVLGNMVFISDEVLENLSAGEYTVTVGINPMGETFVDGDAPAEIAIPLFVEKAVVTIDISNFDKVYDGTPASAEYKISKSSDSSPAASNIVYNEKVEYKAYGADDSTYTETAPVNAGKYTVRITVAETDKITSATETADFTIAKANYNMKGAKWNYTAPFQYDGKVHKVEVVGLPTGVTVESYENNTATAVGDYYAEVNLAYDANNYNAPTINKLGWTIYNDWTPAEYTVTAQNANGWLNENFFIKANEGYLVSFSDNADDFRSDSLACMTQEENIEITFYLQNIRTGAISLGKTVVCSIDKTVPTGKVEFVNRTGWEKFLNTITFNLFYKDEVTIKVTADDNLSGIDKIEYASSDKAMTLDEVKAITNWTEYTDSFGVTLEDAKKFVYFVRITDKAGNVTYLSTDGAEYDTKAPVIEGIENGKTYYTTQKVTVTDKNIDSITLNGDTAGNEITLEGNKVAIYTIIATDKAGNSTTVTVMMKPISDLSAPIDTLTKDNVNSSNEGVVDEVKADVAAVDTTNATDAEKQALKDIADKAAELKKVIDDTVAENDRISDAVDGYDLATVTSDDKDDLEQLLADIEKQLASTNLTEEEVSELNGDKKAVEDLLDTIEDAKKALDDAKAALAELNKPAEPHSPVTGDNSNIWLWFALLFVSSTGVFGITLYDRKRKVANKR